MRNPHIFGTLNCLATKAGEKCGLGWRRHPQTCAKRSLARSRCGLASWTPRASSADVPHSQACRANEPSAAASVPAHKPAQHTPRNVRDLVPVTVFRPHRTETRTMDDRRLRCCLRSCRAARSARRMHHRRGGVVLSPKAHLGLQAAQARPIGALQTLAGMRPSIRLRGLSYIAS